MQSGPSTEGLMQPVAVTSPHINLYMKGNIMKLTNEAKEAVKTARNKEFKHIFIVDVDYSYDTEEFKKRLLKHVSDDWHMPFDECTLVWPNGVTTNLLDKASNFFKKFTIDIGTGMFVDGFFYIAPKGTREILTKNGYNASDYYGTELLLGDDVTNSLFMFVEAEQILRYKDYVTDSNYDGTIFNYFQDALLATVTFFARFCLDVKVFVVEERTKRGGKKANKLKPKQLFRIMHVKDIRKQYLPICTDSTNKKAPHERRRHKHWFRHSRFVNKIGTYVWYESTWIGPKTTNTPDGRLIKVHTEIH